MPAVGNLLNVCGRHRFRVEIDGINQTGFKEVEGVAVHIEVEDIREGTDISSVSRTSPGLIRYGPLVLKNAITGSAGNKDLWTWIKQIIDGDEPKKNVSVVIMDRKGNDKMRFILTGAWPSSWRLGKLESNSGAPLIEELVLQYETLSVT